MLLTPHFTIEELTITQHRGIDNTPSEEVINNLKQLAFKLETVRSLLGGSPLIISSGYRCLSLNRVIGSKDTSAHTKGLAADFICPKFGLAENVFEFLRKQKDLKFDQLIFEDLGGKRWIHIGIKEDPTKYRQEVLIVNSTGTHRA